MNKIVYLFLAALRSIPLVHTMLLFVPLHRRRVYVNYIKRYVICMATALVYSVCCSDTTFILDFGTHKSVQSPFGTIKYNIRRPK